LQKPGKFRDQRKTPGKRKTKDLEYQFVKQRKEKKEETLKKNYREGSQIAKKNHRLADRGTGGTRGGGKQPREKESCYSKHQGERKGEGRDEDKGKCVTGIRKNGRSVTNKENGRGGKESPSKRGKKNSAKGNFTVTWARDLVGRDVRHRTKAESLWKRRRAGKKTGNVPAYLLARSGKRLGEE